MSGEIREQLLGYLLGALEEDERRQVERDLAASPALRRELAQLRVGLRPLLADRQAIAPPRGLWRRTCRFVELTARVMAGSAPASRWSWRDTLVAAVVLVAACLVLFPAVQRSRFQAGVTACQNNLRQLGLALLHYSDHQGGGAFPCVPQHGNDALAGAYAVTLRDCGLLDDARLIVCPAVSAIRQERVYVPTTEELRRARDWRLIQLYRGMMGDYGYALGVVVNDRYVAIRNRGRISFALMADAPSPTLDGRPSANHGRLGQNVLFEDGTVRFVRVVDAWPWADHPFLNDEYRVAPGRHQDDAVIAPAHATPVMFNRP